MTLIPELFSRKPKTQAELDAFNERNRIDLQWRHQKQVYKELKAHHKQEYVYRHKRRGKLRQVYFRQEAGMTILYDSAGLPIGVLDVPTCLPPTPMPGAPSVRRLDAQTNSSSYNITVEPPTRRPGLNNHTSISDLSRIVRGRAPALQTPEGHNPSQTRAPEHEDTLPTPAPSIAEPSADKSNSESVFVIPHHTPQLRARPIPLEEEVSHKNYGIFEAQYEGGGREYLKPTPPIAVPPSLSLRNSDATTPFLHADRVLQPPAGTAKSRKIINFPNEAPPALSSEPGSLNLEGVDASQMPNLSPRKSTSQDWEPWFDGLETFSPMSMSPPNVKGSIAPCPSTQKSERSTGSEPPSEVPNPLDATGIIPSHSVDPRSSRVEQPTSRVSADPAPRLIPSHTLDVGRSTDLPVAQEVTTHQRQPVAGPSANQQWPSAHHPRLPIPPHLRSTVQAAGPSGDGKREAKARAEDEQPAADPSAEVPLIHVLGLSPPLLITPEVRGTKAIFDLDNANRRKSALYNSSIMVCGSLLEINNSLDTECWKKLQVPHHELSSHAWQKSREDLVRAVTTLAFHIQKFPKSNVPVHFFEEMYSKLQDLHFQMHGILTQKDQLEFNRECVKRLNIQLQLIQGLFFPLPISGTPDPSILPPPCFSPQNAPKSRRSAQNLAHSGAQVTATSQQARGTNEGIHLPVQPTDATFLHTSHSIRLSAFDSLQPPQAAPQHSGSSLDLQTFRQFLASKLRFKRKS